ncbi:MAG: ABC transporter permease [Bacteroidota bacterium]
MLLSDLRLALRRLRSEPGYAGITIAGLAVGLACALLLFQYVAYETSFDDFHDDAETLYRLTFTSEQAGEDPTTAANVGHAFGPELAAPLAGVDGVARLHPAIEAIFSDPDEPSRSFQETEVYWADPSFLTLFSFPLVSGDATALGQSGTVLLSESAARRMFGDADPVGRSLTMTARRTTREVQVAAVFADVPATSHLRFEVLLPMADLLQAPMYAESGAGWSWYNFLTYVRLQDNARPAEVEEGLTAGLLRQQDIADASVSLGLQPLRDIHLDTSVETTMGPPAGGASRRSVGVLTLVGIVTLLIALINDVNLSTARATRRSREVGVRKAVGAERRQLVAQFLTESALVNVMAFGLALGLVALAQPAVSEIAGADLSPVAWSLPFWGIAGTVLVVSTLLSGLYPAAVLSSFRPGTALRGGSERGGDGGLRRGLVVVQFGATIVLTVSVLVMDSQLRFVRGLDLGFDLEQVVTVPTPSVRPEGSDFTADVRALRTRLRAIPGVEAVATSHTVPGQGYNMGTSSVRLASADESDTVDGTVTEVDAGFVPLYDIEIVAGDDFPNGETDEELLLASETASRSLGFASPDEIVGTSVVVGGPPRRVVGVFRDLRWTSAHVDQENAFLRLTPAGRQVSIRIQNDAMPETLGAIEAAYTSLFPGNPFRYTFADADYAQLYAADRREARLFTVFAALALGIACLGLFGLAAFTAEERTKEIGIRKVLGASVASLLVLLSSRTLQLVVAAAVVGLPVGWWAVGRWLEAFSDRIVLTPLPFLAAALLVLTLALLTVSVHTVRAATADPIRALRAD